MFSPEFISRFAARRREGPGCWIWTAGRDRKGYGAISFKSRMFKAHRVAWELYHGTTPPADMLVCHDCDTPACVNPKHLFLGSASANSADMVQKGRHRVGIRHKGNANKAAKITPEIVLEIRALRMSGLSHGRIAKRVGVGATQVANILKGKHWSWVS